MLRVKQTYIMGLFGKKNTKPPLEGTTNSAATANPNNDNSSPQPFVDQLARLAKEQAALPQVTLTLTDNNAVFSNDATWHLTATESANLRDKISSLEKALEAKGDEVGRLEREVVEKGKEMNTMRFKESVLLDMLAVSQAEEKASSVKLEKERIKIDQYRLELEKAYRLCAENNVDIAKIE